MIEINCTKCTHVKPAEGDLFFHYNPQEHFDPKFRARVEPFPFAFSPSYWLRKWGVDFASLMTLAVAEVGT
ncbi:uncharacterized protein J3R85_017691 [Psidium guajava]|nr:uncharacterized protein J3R85_017691 [Psidium guajava]